MKFPLFLLFYREIDNLLLSEIFGVFHYGDCNHTNENYVNFVQNRLCYLPLSKASASL